MINNVSGEKPNFKKAYTCANEILVCSRKINTFPFLIMPVINEFTDIRLRTYGDLEKKLNISRSQLKSKDALLMEKNGMFIMFYNELITDKHRIVFSVLHELGHFYLEHDMNKLKELEAKDFSKFRSLYNVYELEANYFAAQLLMLKQIIFELMKKGQNVTAGYLVKTFNVSAQAAQIRIKNMRNTFENVTNINELNYDDILLEKIAAFISENSPKKKWGYYSMEEEYEKQAERDNWQ